VGGTLDIFERTRLLSAAMILVKTLFISWRRGSLIMRERRSRRAVLNRSHFARPEFVASRSRTFGG
jgi:hypothetical protein